MLATTRFLITFPFLGTILASNIQLAFSDLHVYNIQRVRCDGVALVTTKMTLQSMSHHPSQQVSRATIEMANNETKAQISIKNGGHVLVFRDSNLLFPEDKELYGVEEDRLPHLKINRSITLAKDDLLVLINAEAGWKAKPTDLVGTFAHAGEIDAEFFPPFLAHEKKRGLITLIVAKVIQLDEKESFRGPFIVDPDLQQKRVDSNSSSSSSSSSFSLPDSSNINYKKHTPPL